MLASSLSNCTVLTNPYHHINSQFKYCSMLEELTLIIDSYLHDLEEVSKQLDNSPYRKMHDVQLLITKINLQISMLQSTSHTLLKYSEGKDSGLVRIKSYLTNTFSALIK